MILNAVYFKNYDRNFIRGHNNLESCKTFKKYFGGF